MTDPDSLTATHRPPQTWLVLLLGVLCVVCATVLKPFLIPLLWALILAYTSWPAYRLIVRLCRHRSTPAALLMTSLMGVALIGPLLGVAALLQDELTALYHAITATRAPGLVVLPMWLRDLPWVGTRLQEALRRYAEDPALLRQFALEWMQSSHDTLLDVGRGLSRNLVKLLVALFSLFFFYRDGAALARQRAYVVQRFFGDRLDPYLRAAGRMTRAVIFGLLVTALVQGLIAGIGYALFGVEAPVLLGVVTALASIVPVVGTFLVWGVASVALVMSGHLWPGIGLLAWGTVLVHPADNLIRPLLISNATQMPFLLIMFGVVGGLAAFGLVGLFIGPVALAVATAVWREWLDGPRRENGHRGGTSRPQAG